LTGEWVLVSAQRTQRPWLGSVDPIPPAHLPERDPACYLCPGSTRANGAENPDYSGPWVFDNDFPALLPAAATTTPRVGAGNVGDPLFHASSETGTCRVVCFSPRHDLALGELEMPVVRAVIDTWADETAKLGELNAWVQVFENRGEAMGASNPHPHGQIWATSSVPTMAFAEDAFQRQYAAEHDIPLLVDYTVREAAAGTRVVLENQAWLVVVPYWAVWPFETLVLPRRHVRRLPELDDLERDALASILRRLVARYDNLFHHPFPYSMGWHGAPYDGEDPDHWQLHGHAYPPLLRSATIRKFVAGFEMLAEPQRDLTAEDAAGRLRVLSDVHFRIVAAGGNR